MYKQYYKNKMKCCICLNTTNTDYKKIHNSNYFKCTQCSAFVCQKCNHSFLSMYWPKKGYCPICRKSFTIMYRGQEGEYFVLAQEGIIDQFLSLTETFLLRCAFFTPYLIFFFTLYLFVSLDNKTKLITTDNYHSQMI